MTFELGTIKTSSRPFRPYHDHRKTLERIDPERKPFIAWDGEGANLDGPNKPQSYILFGSSCTEFPPLTAKHHLSFWEIADHILSVGKANPNAFHVAYSFGYDVNMIVRSLNTISIQKLHSEKKLTLRRRNRAKLLVQYMPKKWFSITEYGIGYDRKTNPHAKTTVRIYDLFSFFAKKFIVAYEELVGPPPKEVVEGKNNRNNFDTLGMGYIERYWSIEIQMLQKLAEELRARVYGADLRIRQWYGPGALASYALAKHNIQTAMSKCPPPVQEAAKYAYAGGRFEIFQLGRITGKIYSIDINSAYPYGISQLPNLTTGRWIHRVGKPDKIQQFAVYRVKLKPLEGDTPFPLTPGPLFHRDNAGNISFPWKLEGWYWSPEVRNLKNIDPRRYEIIEGWEYVGWQRKDVSRAMGIKTSFKSDSVPNSITSVSAASDRPFHWIRDMYDTRRRWKEMKLAAQLALKLCMNSIYGKLAQRVGWNEIDRSAPKWHQLEWAGWVTSLTRAMLFDVMLQIPQGHLIAVETDGLYTTIPPEQLGIKNSTELGGWEVTEYDEIMYVQSGLAHLRHGTKWIEKRRGLDAKSFNRAQCEQYLKKLTPGNNWPVFKAETTRFIGMGAALNRNPVLKGFCVWETSERDIQPGREGKRVHLSSQCVACSKGATAYDTAHDMSVRSKAYAPKCSMSKAHDIPWHGDESPAWRKQDEISMGMESL